ETGRLDEAIAAHRQAVRLGKEDTQLHLHLGLALAARGRLDEAIASYRQAIRLAPDNAKAHCRLGQALGEQGRLADALVSLRRGHALGSRGPGWSYPSGVWVRECEYLIELEPRLPAILAGKQKPASARERIALAYLCTVKQLYTWAAHFSAQALAAGGAGGE